MNKIIKNIKGMYNVKSIFIESYDPDKKENIIIRGLMMPKDAISRNKVKYDWDSVVKHHKELINKSMMYNHLIDTEMPPMGHYTDSIILEQAPAVDSKWYSAWKKTADQNGHEVGGWYYESSLNPDNIYTKSILRGDLNNVSIQLMADEAYEQEDFDGVGRFTLAKVGNILEASAVPVPGFEQTSIDVALAEAFQGLTQGEERPEDSKEKDIRTPVEKEEDRVNAVVKNPTLDETIPQTTVDEVDRVKDDYGGFPMEIFHTQLKKELNEHPELDHLTIAQLVLDHLKEKGEGKPKEGMDTTSEPKEGMDIATCSGASTTKLMGENYSLDDLQEWISTANDEDLKEFEQLLV